VEVVVVDNASSDDTAQVLEATKGKIDALTVVMNPDNRGFAAACNQAARAATGEVLCFLNNDTVVTPGWLWILVRALEEDPTLGLVGPVSNGVANEARVKTSYSGVDDLGLWAELQSWRHDGRSFPITMLALYCAALRRQAWDRVGELDEAFGLGMFEDDDYCRRLRQAGFHIRCRRDCFVHHWQQASFQLLDARGYLELYERNRAYLRSKWGRGGAKR
jgi:GT2 family glycosyltransferase